MLLSSPFVSLISWLSIDPFFTLLPNSELSTNEENLFKIFPKSASISQITYKSLAKLLILIKYISQYKKGYLKKEEK